MSTNVLAPPSMRKLADNESNVRQADGRIDELKTMLIDAHGEGFCPVGRPEMGWRINRKALRLIVDSYNEIVEQPGPNDAVHFVPDNGFKKLKVDHHRVTVGKLQAGQTDSHVAGDGCFKGVWSISSGHGAAAISQSELAGKSTVDRKAL